jgi:hypothetical protein
MKDNAMKKLLTIAAIAALAISAQAQRQTFTQPAYFTTNVFLADNTNTPLHLRVPTNAVLDGVTSTNGSLTVTTNAGVVNLQVVFGDFLATTGGVVTGTINMGAESTSQIIGVNNVGKFYTGDGGWYIGFEEGIFFGNTNAGFGGWAFETQPIIPGYLTTTGSAAGLTGFPASLVTVSAANTNYYRFTAAPASNTAFGLQHQIAYNSTNIFIYHAASQKWGRATLTLEW